MNRKRVAILISGGGSNMAALCDSMTGDHPARPVLVLSSDPDAPGLRKAQNRGIATAVVDLRALGGDREAFEAAMQAKLADARPDILCLAGFMRILSPAFIGRWQGRILNIHPSLLPKFRGLHTHVRVLAAGAREHGCTVHEVTPELDDGPILGQARLIVHSADTAETLAARVLVREHLLYPAVLRRFARGDRRPVMLS